MAAAPVRYAHGLLVTASAGLVALAVSGAVVALCLTVTPLGETLGFGLSIAASLSAVLVAFAARTRLVAGRAGSAAALTFGAWVPAFWLLSWLSLGAHGEANLAMLLAFTALPFELAIAVMIAPFFLPLERTLGRMARVVAWPALLLATVVVGLAVVRCATRPDVADYVTSLPPAKVVDYGPVPLPSATVTYVRRAGDNGSKDVCEITMGTSVLYDQTQTDEMNPDESQPCGGLELRHDARLGLWTFTDRTPARAPKLTLDDHGKVRTRDQRTLAKSVAPPRAWVAGAAIGIVLAALSLLFAALHRRAAQRLSGEEAVNAGGRVTLADGTSIDLASARALPDGPIVVEVQTPAASYRENVAPIVRVLRGGSLGDAREQLEARARGCSLAALVVVMLGGASLTIAALCRLVI